MMQKGWQIYIWNYPAVKWKAAVTMVLTEAAAGNQTMRKYAGKGDESLRSTLDGAEITGWCRDCCWCILAAIML